MFYVLYAVEGRKSRVIGEPHLAVYLKFYFPAAQVFLYRLQAFDGGLERS